MDRMVTEKIIELQDSFRDDPEGEHYRKAHEILNARFLAQLETMNDAQKDAVLDYLGLLIEMHLKYLEFAVQMK